MRGLTELVFSTTNQCPARCQDCPVVFDGAEHVRLSADVMIRLIDEVVAWGSLRLVVFTGGESFLLGRDLRRTVAHAGARGLSTRIVTNAYWATSAHRAIDVLRELKAVGLTEINISCDDYHQAFIPLKRVKYANDAAKAIGLPALLAHRRKPGGQLTVEAISTYLGAELHHYREGEKNPDNDVICTGRNVPLNSRSTPGEAPPWELPEHDTDWMGACPSVLRSIVINSDRQVHICCGIARIDIPELSIGSLDYTSLIEILDQGNRDLIVNWLALEGPASILEFVRNKDPNLALPEHYVNRCHLCNELFTRDDVRSVLQAHAAERRDALLMLRSTLDWVSEDWAASSATSPQSHGLNTGAPAAVAG